MLPYLQIGPVRVWTYGLMLCLALWVGFVVFGAEVRRKKLRIDPALTMLTIAVAGIVGAKLYHVLVTVLWIERGRLQWADVPGFAGLAWNGGLIAGFAALVCVAVKSNESVWKVLDAASPAAALGYAFGRMGCFLSGDGDYGIPTSLPWGMSFPHGLVPTTARVHPTPLYEIATSLLLFWILTKLARKEAPGTVFAAYLIGSGVFRFAVEFIRRNERAFLGMTEAQVVSVVAVMVGAVLLSRTQLAHPSKGR